MNSLNMVNSSILQDCFDKLNQTQKNLDALNGEIFSEIQDIKCSISKQQSYIDSYNFRYVKKNETLCLLDDVLTKIFLCLNSSDLFNATTTCKRWNNIFERPETFQNWLHLNNPLIYENCNKLPLEIKVFYQKKFISLDRNDRQICKIKKDQDSILKLNALSLVILSPILAPIAIKPVVFILKCVDANMEKTKNFIINSFLEDNPGATMLEAEAYYLRWASELYY